MQNENERPSAARPTDGMDPSVGPEESLPIVSAAAGPTSIEGAGLSHRSEPAGCPSEEGVLRTTLPGKAQESQARIERRREIRVAEREYLRSARGVQIVRVCNRRVGSKIVSIHAWSPSAIVGLTEKLHELEDEHLDAIVAPDGRCAERRQ